MVNQVQATGFSLSLPKVFSVHFFAIGANLPIVLSGMAPTTLWINEKNIPYYKIRDGKMEAKCTRTAYYELAEMIVEHKGGFSFKIEDRLYPVNTEGA